MKYVQLAVIAVLVLAIVWLCAAIVRLENYRHANFVGMCSKYNSADAIQRIQREECLEKIPTRTHWYLHLLNGLKVL